jgi:hypothetical protein
MCKRLFVFKEYLNVLSTDNGQSIWKESIKKKNSLPRGLGTKLLIAYAN